MANVIIGIHGLCNKPPKQLLEHWWKLSMMEGLEAGKFNAKLPKFEMVYWADIMYDKPLDESETNPESPYFIDEKYEKGTKPVSPEDHHVRLKVVNYMCRQLHRIFLNKDLSLNYSFITDKIVGKYFRDLDIYYSDEAVINGRKAKELIRDRLFQVLEKHKKDTILLVSHSMGTIIAFDVLTFLAPSVEVNTFITIGSPLGLPVVVGKIAAEQKQMNRSESYLVTPPGIKNWYNFADICDSVALDYQLADNFSENSNGVKPVDFLVENDYETNGVANPHKSFGYLRTPEFSGILNEFIQTEKLSLKEKIVRWLVRVADFLKNVFSRK